MGEPDGLSHPLTISDDVGRSVAHGHLASSEDEDVGFASLKPNLPPTFGQEDLLQER